jgi:aspartyl-tRNA(Asn)/glutamyl-tRNA(Gln) amidotransferase subunit C
MLKSSKLFYGAHMQVDDTLLSKLEKLSYLKVDENKREQIEKELSDFVNFVENLNTLDTGSADPVFAMTSDATPTRDDKPSCDTHINDDILSHAPNSDDHFFIVPKIIE